MILSRRAASVRRQRAMSSARSMAWRSASWRARSATTRQPQFLRIGADAGAAGGGAAPIGTSSEVGARTAGAAGISKLSSR